MNDRHRWTTLVSAEALAAALARGGDDAPRIFDCSFDLADPAAGRRGFAACHVAGADYIDLERTLSAVKTGRNGRHPLPSREEFVRRMAAFGLDDDDQIVACDNAGSMYAARLWWMLRWVGHVAAAVLDGGLAAWQAAGQTLSDQPPPPRRTGDFSLRASLVAQVDFEAVRANVERPERLVIDARAPDRFRGENETLDPIGGHIPGARNRLFKDNLGADGRFKPAASLRDDFVAVAGGRPSSELILQCGSGVTACHNLLAMEVAGLSGAALYPGSWSEWSAQPGAPIATGPATP